jgi:uncharacterized protein (DUF2252 family)
MPQGVRRGMLAHVATKAENRRAGTPGKKESAARGREARGDAPRVGQSAVIDDCRDPVGILEEQATSRVPELVPVRYGRMLVSPFTFYRGAAAIMAYDLAATTNAHLDVQLCGDAHLANFGVYASPDRSLVFDLNDFDETARGPFEWDLKRLATSFEICGRDRQFSKSQRRAAMLGMLGAYRDAMRTFADMGNLEVWYARLDVETIRTRLREQNDRRIEKNVRRGAEKARTKDSMKALARLTEVVDGEVRIASDRPLVVPISELVTDTTVEELRAELSELVMIYRSSLPGDRQMLLDGYEVADAAHKVVGVGSVGTRAWILLLLGRDGGDPLFLQAKEAQPSVVEQYTRPSDFSNHGQRVVAGQRLMQSSSDILLGWGHVAAGLDGQSRDFYVRQLWDWKRSVDLESILPRGLEIYGRVCGWTLARAHARSGDRVSIAAYLGKKDVFDRALADFAEAYADINQSDYQLLLAAAASGRIEVVHDI